MEAKSVNKTLDEILADLLSKEQADLAPSTNSPMPEIDFASQASALPESAKDIPVQGRTIYHRGPGALPKYPRYSVSSISKRIEYLSDLEPSVEDVWQAMRKR